MQQEWMTCAQCKRRAQMDWLNDAEAQRVMEHAGVRLSAPDGWVLMVTHCPLCHMVVISLVSAPGQSPELRWPGRAHVAATAEMVRTVTFRAAWAQLAEHGVCDELDGAEYRRCAQEWADAGHPADVCTFIGINANRGSPALGELPILEVIEEEPKP